jgi:hypothetical protein
MGRAVTRTLPACSVPWSLHRRLGVGLSRGEPGVDGVLVGLEDADLHDLVVLDPVDVGASDVEDVLAGTEPLVHEQRDMVLPDEGVDQVERLAPPARATAARM